MSNALYHAVRRRGPSGFGERAVLLATAFYADASGHASPPISRLAADLSLSQRAARRIVRRLEAQGWLRIDARGGGRATNTYAIAVERLDVPSGPAAVAGVAGGAA